MNRNFVNRASCRKKSQSWCNASDSSNRQPSPASERRNTAADRGMKLSA
jgi:hypothetical protein